MTRFFTSDLHLGHRAVLNFCRRPFSDVGNMERLLVINWNEVVAPADEVWILGDFAMGKITETLPVGKRLHGRKYLIAGNHDRPFYYSDDGPLRRQLWREAYAELGGLYVFGDPWVDLHVAGRIVRACHFPYRGDHTAEDRYLEARPPDDGLVLLHGHTHGAWVANGRMIDVGVDNWDYRPVSEDELRPLIIAAAG